MNVALQLAGWSTQHIYAIEAGEGGPIKFGMAKNPAQRLKELQTGNPENLRLLASALIATDMECRVHYYLRASHIRGEWFRPTEEVLAIVQKIKEQKDASNDHVIGNYICDRDPTVREWFIRRMAGIAA